MASPVVFLSAASIDLKEWREVLHGAFSRAGFRVLTQDQSLGSAPGDVRRLLTETIAESDCIIHLAGMGYGSDATDPFTEAPGFQCSWTQFEYYHGHREKMDLIAFVCAPGLFRAGLRRGRRRRGPRAQAAPPAGASRARRLGGVRRHAAGGESGPHLERAGRFRAGLAQGRRRRGGHAAPAGDSARAASAEALLGNERAERG
jgi:hypothetical protein